MSKISLLCFIPEENSLDSSIISINKRQALDLKSLQGITAIFKKISNKEYCQQFSGKKIPNAEATISSLLVYEEIIEQIMHYSSVFPARFGTLFSSLSYLEKEMIQHYSFIEEFLHRSFRKTEWAVKIYLKEAQAITAFATSFSYPNLSANNNVGTHYLLEKRIQYDTKKKLPSYLDAIYQDVLKKLNISSADFRSREIDKAIYNNAKNELPLVKNWTFLIENSRISGFRDLFNQVEKDYKDYGLIFKLSGPWPPYSFCCFKNN